MRLYHLGKTILACVATFLILCTAGCYFDADDVRINTSDSGTAWTPIGLYAGIYSWGSSYQGSWKIKNAGTTRARINGYMLFTMAPGTVTLTVTFKNKGEWNKDVIKDFTIKIDPAPEEIHALGTELVTHGVNTADKPVSLKANIDLEAHWENLLMMLIVADRYVNIDFTGSTGTKITRSTEINNNRYREIPKLLSVVLPDSIISIGNSTFSGCTSLTGVTIGNNVTSIGYSAFSDCSSLGGITIPDSVTRLGDSAFRDCSNLASVTIGNNVTKILASTFSGCSRLETIIVNSGNTTYSSIDGIVYDKTAATLILCPEGKSGTVNIPDGVTSIENFAFNDCNKIAIISIPDSVNMIGDPAFRGCTSLETINVNSGNTMYSSINGIVYNKTADTLILCPKGKSGTVNIPDGVTSIGDYSFSQCGKITGITIPNSVTSIGKSAFCDCTNLASVTIPNSVASIESGAFLRCNKITSVIIPNSVTSIEEYAFWGCTNLTRVTFEGVIEKTGFNDKAFYGDLQFKYFATNGGPGTYTRQSENRWSKK
jgi:hypothetical protein